MYIPNVEFAQTEARGVASHVETAVGRTLLSGCVNCRRNMFGTLLLNDQARTRRCQGVCTIRGHLET